MANSSGPRLLENRKYCEYHIKLHNAATISVTKDKDYDEKTQQWRLLYDVEGMGSLLCIFRTTERNSGDESLCIDVKDCSYIKTEDSKAVRPHPTEHIFVTVRKEKKKAGLLCYADQVFLTNEQKVKKCGESRSAVVETEYWAYGCGTRMGLLVMEKKKKRSNEERPYMVTVAHYYVNSGSGGRGVDIGFSVVVKIGVTSHNGQLDFSVDGPVEHPSSALLYMIQEVTRTGTWTLSACPHCKDNQRKQRRWVSESEDSDTPLPPPPPRYGDSQNAANMGRFNGDGNGSIFQATKINFIKWWK